MTPAGQRTLAEIKNAVEEKQSATLVALTTLLDALAKKGETVSLSELAALVKCDTRLTTRVLVHANSLTVKRSSDPITSIPEAFHLLGLSRIRSLVLASLLAQHADSGNHAQREVAVVSLSSGLLAQSMADTAGEDREQAFLCGSLRNYGHLLLSTFRPAEFDRAKAAILAGANEEQAYTAVFGLTPWALAEEMLTELRFPRAMIEAITRPPSACARERRSNSMLNFAAGAVSFTELMFDPRVEPDSFRSEAKTLLRRHVPDAGIASNEALDDFLGQQKTLFGDFARYIGCSPLAHRPMISISRRIADAPIHRNSIVETRSSFDVAAINGRPLTLEEQLALAPESLERVLLANHASEALLFSLDNVTGAFHTNRGVGGLFTTLRGSRVFEPGEKNLLGLSVSLRQCLVIHDRNDPNLQGHLPNWMKTSNGPMAFFLFPFGGPPTTHLLMVGWPHPRKVTPPQAADLLRQASTSRAAKAAVHAEVLEEESAGEPDVSSSAA